MQKSIESKLKLLGVARGSLEELLKDYEDYLRQHRLILWDKDSQKHVEKNLQKIHSFRTHSYTFFAYISLLCFPDFKL